MWGTCLDITIKRSGQPFVRFIFDHVSKRVGTRRKCLDNGFIMRAYLDIFRQIWYINVSVRGILDYDDCSIYFPSRMYYMRRII